MESETAKYEEEKHFAATEYVSQLHAQVDKTHRRERSKSQLANETHQGNSIQNSVSGCIIWNGIFQT